MTKIFFSGVAVFLIIAYAFIYLDYFHGYIYSLTYPWFDSMLHTLGGIYIGLVAMWFLYFFRISPRLFYVLISVLIVGLAWELMEYVLSFPRSPHMSYELDTLKDLVLDLIGGIFAWAYSRHL